MSATPARAFMTIGEVLEKLRPDFPEVTISKIRFLESERLIEPARTPSGYRKFTYVDLERLRYVLRAQRDHYLPLRVIREQLEAIDHGGQLGTAGGAGGAGPPVPRALAPTGNPGDAQPHARHDSPQDDRSARLTREELLETTGLGEQQLRELETYGLVHARVGRAPYDADALHVARIVAELATFGLGPRHLRAAKSAADREAGLVEQVVAPLLRQRGPDAQARAQEMAGEIAALSVKLHGALVQSELRAVLGR